MTSTIPNSTYNAPTDSEQLRQSYEAVVRHNPSNYEAVHYLAMWHLERHSFVQAKRYFGHLATLKDKEAEVWICLAICCTMTEEFADCVMALKLATFLIDSNVIDVRILFCQALLSERQRDFAVALDGYIKCVEICSTYMSNNVEESKSMDPNGALGGTQGTGAPNSAFRSQAYIQEMLGEVRLRIAIVKNETNFLDQSMTILDSLIDGHFGHCIRAHALCLKGIIFEKLSDFPSAEMAYRSSLQIMSGHSVALERLGRVYQRYRETIPAAVQCFFKAVETNQSNHQAWYLLGRCYMATAQYDDAFEAYKRAVNLNPNDPQVWCSLGVLYYAFGQYKEALGMLARALKLDSTMADAWYNVGALYDMCNQHEDAQQAYLKANEFGLADRFTRVGLVINPLTTPSVVPASTVVIPGNGDHISSSISHSAGTHVTAHGSRPMMQVFTQQSFRDDIDQLQNAANVVMDPSPLPTQATIHGINGIISMADDDDDDDDGEGDAGAFLRGSGDI